MTVPKAPDGGRLVLTITEPQPGIGQIHIKGTVAKWDIDSLNAAVEGLTGRGVRRIIFDLSQTELVASGVFGCFITYSDQAARSGGQVIFAAVPDIVQVVFDRLGLTEMFCFAVSGEAAVRQLSEELREPRGTTRRRKKS